MFKAILLKELKLLGSLLNRILSFLVLILSLFFIYHFALEKNSKLSIESLIGIKWTSIFILSYILISQISEDEKESGAFEINQIYISRSFEFISKSVLCFVGLFIVFLIENFLILILFEEGKIYFNSFQFIFLFHSILPILSLSFLGIMVSELGYETEKKELILPILLIPLIIPVLLLTIQSETKLILSGEFQIYSMLVLFSFSILYLSLGLILKEYILS